MKNQSNTYAIKNRCKILKNENFGKRNVIYKKLWPKGH